MTNAEEQRKIFWEIFEEILMENGEPFKIAYQKKSGEITDYSQVNKYFIIPCKICINLRPSFTKGVFRVDFYIPETKHNVRDNFIYNKEQIESMITKPLLWENGVKKESVLRPSVYFNFVQYDVEDYRRVIEESLPTIIEFINVANKYGKDEFFDF